RHGSLVAAADGRSIWFFTLVAIAGSATISSPFWGDSGKLSALLVVGLGLAVLTGLMGLLAIDANALERVRAIERWMDREAERLSQAEAATVVHSPMRRIDFGVGSGTCAELREGSYRSARRAERLVVGCPHQAASILRRAMVRDMVGLGAC